MSLLGLCFFSAPSRWERAGTAPQGAGGQRRLRGCGKGCSRQPFSLSDRVPRVSVPVKAAGWLGSSLLRAVMQQWGRSRCSRAMLNVLLPLQKPPQAHWASKPDFPKQDLSLLCTYPLFFGAA